MKPVYDVLDTYVTDNNGRRLHGIMVLEEIEGQGLHEAEFYYDSTKQELWLYGHDASELADREELLEGLHVRLYDYRREAKRTQDVMRSPLEALVCTVGFYWRRFAS